MKLTAFENTNSSGISTRMFRVLVISSTCVSSTSRARMRERYAAASESDFSATTLELKVYFRLATGC